MKHLMTNSTIKSVTPKLIMTACGMLGQSKHVSKTKNIKYVTCEKCKDAYNKKLNVVKNRAYSEVNKC